MSDKYFITSPIYYVNDVPHIGSAYTSLACDIIARFMRLDGKEVKFLTGTDEHGRKVEQSAEKLGLKPKDFTDKLSESFRLMSIKLNLSNDDFIRTTEERHIKGAKAFWNKLQENGFIYLDKYSGWYSVRDEAFYSEAELTEDGLAPTGATVEWIEEPSYFFKLSAFEGPLLKFYEENPDFIGPKHRMNEIVNFVKSGLSDLSISRTSFSWGIKVPGDEKHIMYVWLDALTNYITALGYPDLGGEYKKFWPADVHLMGKDITRFHAVYWPAFLMAAGLDLPKRVMAHGWWTNEGEKISKSLGNVIDPIKLVDEFGLDQTRYFLMREIIFGNDGNFSREGFIQRVNAELSNNIGNLIQRTVSFVEKYVGRKVPDITPSDIEKLYDLSLLQEAKSLIVKARKQMQHQDFSSMLNDIIGLASSANIYIDKEAPWSLRNTDTDKMHRVLYVLLECIRYVAILLAPFVPDASKKILDILNVNVDERTFKHLSQDFALKPGREICAPYPIFPKIEK